MKKGLCLISVLLIVSSLMGSYLDETKTMDATLFSNLYDAIDYDSGHDEIMRFYWDKWMQSANPNPTTRYEGENEYRENRATYDPINWAYTYSKNSLIGALAVDIDDDVAQEYLDNVQDHLIFNPYSTHNNYLKLFSDYVGEESVFGQDIDGNGIWEDGEYSDGSWGDCLSYSSMLNSIANIVDNLWYYNVQNQTDLHNKLEELAGWANELLSESNFSGGYAQCTNPDYPPQLCTSYHNGRIRLAGALGYAGCVLGNEEFIETAENDLFVRSLPGGKNGFIEFMTSNSGTYNEGISYTEYTFEGLAKFFTARKRLTFDFSNIPDNNNWFEDDRVRDIYVNSLDLISPSMANVPFDDVHETYVRTGASNPLGYLYKPRKIFSECITYYYQSPVNDTDSRNHIKWLVNNYKSHTGYANYYTTGWNTNKFYVYQYDTSRILAGNCSTPEHLTNGNFSNEELTIFRRPIQTYNDYQDYPVLYVNHENSVGNSGHEHSDQSSFILYYKDKQLLIDPGYRPSWYSYYLGKEWLASPYAHNVIMVNPYDEYYNAYSSSNFNLIEENELNGDYRDLFTSLDEWNDPEDNNPNHIKFKFNRFEPIGDAGDFNDVIPLNPAHKNYLISNNSITHLQIELDYDHPQSHYPPELVNDEINVKRNFYSIDLESEIPYFIIYDELTSSDHSIENDFMNQLHFALYPVPNNNIEFPNNPDNINDPSNDNGQFTYTHFENDVFLHGAMGSNGISEYSIRDTLPQGLYYGRTWDGYILPPQWMHKCMRTKTSTDEDEQFLTLLFPSENDTTPIEQISQAGATYAVKYSLNTGYNCYAAVSDASNVNYGDIRFVTDTSFLLVEANNIFTDLKKLILNSDNFLEVRDMSGTDFVDVVVFDSDYDSEEVIAEWSESGELEITTLMSFTSPIPLPIPNPKYKILRCGVLPEDLISKTHYYSSGDTTPQERGTIGNNIESLAYDDNYFYVNYGYSDLASDNLLTSELTIYQGVFDGITIQGVTQFGTGDIVLKNEIPVPFGTEIVFLPGSQPQLYSNFHLIVDGDLTALGTAENNIIFDKYSSTNWNKIEITNDGNANMKFCKFLNAQFPLYNNGYVDIEYCEFLDNSGGIYLDNPTGYQINHSIINNCGYGILIKDSHILMYRSSIKNNLITNNNYGLWFYNASAYVETDTIFSNKYVGIMANRGSNPVIVGSSISSTYYNSNDYPEIKISGSSYPIVDRNENDIIFGNGHSIYNMDIEPRDYRCSENWWGTTNELAISNSFYPLNWLIDFTPISQSPNVGYNPWSGGSLFEEGLLAESNGDLITAKTKYTQSIDEDPDGIEALWSVSRLINCSETEIEYAELLLYYDQLQIDYTQTDLAEAAKLDKIFCNRLLGNYQDAITEYEFLLDENLTFIDSVFTQLDIVYTYMEASSGGNRANVTFQNSDNALSSVKQAEEREVELWGLLEGQITEGGIYSPEISKAILHKNYPNPFNPTTMISFSILDESKVNLSIYNIKGQKVKTLVNESLVKGIHQVLWNGRNDNNRSVASGVYLYKLNVNGKDYSVKKCLMLK